MSGSPAGRGDRAAGVDSLHERPVLVVGLLDEHRVHRLDVHVRDALGVLAAQLHRVAVAVDDVPGVEAEAHVLGVGRLEDAVDVVGGLDVAVAVRVQDHLQAVVLLHDPPQLVGVLDVEVPGVGGENPVVGVVTGLLVTEHRRKVNDVLCAHGGMGLTDRTEELLGVVPRLGLVQDAPSGAGDDAESAGVHLLLQAGRLGREVAEGAGLHDGEAGGGHLVEGDVPVDLLLVLGEPHAPLVGTHTDRQLAVSGVGVAGLELRHGSVLPGRGLRANLVTSICSVNRS